MRPDGDEPLRLLHVDDDPSYLEFSVRAFERVAPEVEVTTANSAADGLARLYSDGPAVDCVLSDYQMPEMDGLEFLTAVRADFPNLPLVLVTGQGSEEVAERAFRVGVTDYYRKGSGLEQFRLLHNRLERYIEAARAQSRLEVVEGELDYWKAFAPAAVVLDPGGRIAAASITSRDVFGAEELDELLGLDIWELVAPAEREEIREVIERVQREAAAVVCRDRTLRDLEGGTTTTTVQWRPVEYWGEEALLAVMNDFNVEESGLVSAP